MVKEFTDSFEYPDVRSKTLTYTLQYNQADSQESLLGLGVIPNNQRSWFGFISKEPYREGLFDPGNVHFTL